MHSGRAGRGAPNPTGDESHRLQFSPSERIGPQFAVRDGADTYGPSCERSMKRAAHGVGELRKQDHRAGVQQPDTRTILRHKEASTTLTTRSTTSPPWLRSSRMDTEVMASLYHA